MTTSDDTTIAQLQTLLRRYRDGAAAFAEADRELPDPEIAGELTRFREERFKLIEEAEERLRELRTSPAPDSAATASLTIEFGSADSGNAVARLLGALERNEDLTLELLVAARRENDVDARSRQLFERHYERVQTSHDRIKQLRDRCLA